MTSALQREVLGGGGGRYELHKVRLGELAERLQVFLARH
jgi:hypothetical protein